MCSQIRGTVGALPRARNLHRVLITDATHWHPRNSGGVPRKPHPHRQIRESAPAPRPAATAAGKFNSVTTLLRYLEVCSRLQRLVTRRLGFAKLAMGEPIEFPRRSSGAATLRSGAVVLVCAGNNEAQGLRLGLYGPRDGVRGVPVGVGLANASIGNQKSKSENHPVGRSRVESTRAKKYCPGRRQIYGFSFHKREGRT